MARYAIVEDGTGLVVNVVIWDGDPWEPPAGTTAVEDAAGIVGPGWTYADGVFTPPPPPPEEPPA